MKRTNPLTKIVLTGGSGFLGYHLLNKEAFREALAIGKTKPCNHQHFFEVSFEANQRLAEAFNNKEVVVHLAARVHVMNDSAKRPLDEFRHVNTLGTINLAKQAAIAGVKRFIFISSIKVLGEQTLPGKPFKSGDSFNPQDAYGISKMEAEVGLKMIGKAYGMEIVIIRAPLVYGQGVKGNFASLLKLAKFSIPLPLKSIQNKRSLVSVENLADLIIICLNHPNAKNETFLVSDDDDMSTSVLFSRLAESGGYKAYLFSLPIFFLYIFFRVLGKSAIFNRLCGSMQIDIEYTKSQLNWKPPFKVKDSLSSCWQLDTKMH